MLRDYKKICHNIEIYRNGISCKKSLIPLEKLVLVLEDRRFYYHPGFDLFSIFRASLRRVQKRKITGGASTIEQQFVRTVTNRREYKISRKIREIFLATLISTRYEKNLILRVYLKIAYVGYNLVGVNRASLFFYNKEIQNLNLRQASHIAALLKYPAPSILSTTWQGKVNRRSDYAEYVLQTKKSPSIKLIRNI